MGVHIVKKAFVSAALATVAVFSSACANKDSHTLVAVSNYPSSFVSLDGSISYQRLNDENESKRIGDVNDFITQENVIGLLANRDEVPSVSEGLTIYVPTNETDEVTFNGKKISVPIYKLSQFDQGEYVALCASWFVTIYKKAA